MLTFDVMAEGLAKIVLRVTSPFITHWGVIKCASDRVTFPFNSHLGCDLRNASCKAIKRLLEYDDSWMNKRSVCQVYIKIECSSMNIIVPQFPLRILSLL